MTSAQVLGSSACRAWVTAVRPPSSRCHSTLSGSAAVLVPARSGRRTASRSSARSREAGFDVSGRASGMHTTARTASFATAENSVPWTAAVQGAQVDVAQDVPVDSVSVDLEKSALPPLRERQRSPLRDRLSFWRGVTRRNDAYDHVLADSTVCPFRPCPRTTCAPSGRVDCFSGVDSVQCGRISLSAVTKRWHSGGTERKPRTGHAPARCSPPGRSPSGREQGGTKGSQKNNTLMSDSRAPSCGKRLAELQDLPDHRRGRHALQRRLTSHLSWSPRSTTTICPRTGISVLFFCTPQLNRPKALPASEGEARAARPFCSASATRATAR